MTSPTTPSAIADPPGLDLGALGRWFAQHVGTCQGELTATMLHGGRSNLTYHVTDGRASWVVRRPPLGGLTPSAHDVAREYRVMTALRGSGVAVPHPLALCVEEDVIGAPFTVVSYVEGRVLRYRTDIAEFTPYDLRRWADGLVEQLARLHFVDYDLIGLGRWGRPQGYLRRQVDRWRVQWDLVATRPLPDLLRLYQALDPADLGRVRAIVDWELSTVGDPLADIGTFLAYRKPAVDALLDGPAATDPRFPEPLELAEQYALVSGRDLTQLPFYRALAHFKIAVIAEGVHARHRQGVTVGEGFAGAADSVPELVLAGLSVLGRAR
ncbi:phosphotransferase family protein [Streptomyces sp. UG1]|uniref:phosphotransferase family protein n=1 Tax=Streptomyces sp. UG1 TaxID=3417652 RepID=UPI003CF29977